MTIEEVAKKLGISSRSVYRMIDSGVLPAKMQARKITIYAWVVDDKLVEKVSSRLQGATLPREVIKIIKEIKN